MRSRSPPVFRAFQVCQTRYREQWEEMWNNFVIDHHNMSFRDVYLVSAMHPVLATIRHFD
jgi:hypothetical protein